MAEKMTLTAALERYKKLTDRHGCTDGGCVVQRPTGMHTNGGCRCSRDPHTAHGTHYACYGEDPKVTSIPTPLPKATPNAHE
jgi:hypothetical protein